MADRDNGETEICEKDAELRINTSQARILSHIDIVRKELMMPGSFGTLKLIPRPLSASGASRLCTRRSRDGQTAEAGLPALKAGVFLRGIRYGKIDEIP